MRTRWWITVAAFTLVAIAAHPVRADEPLYKCKEADPSAQLRASFKPEISVADLAAWVLGFTCKNIVISADVPKHVTKVTVIAPNAMTPKQALQLFVDALDAAGLTVTVKPDTIIVALGPKFPRGCPDAKAATPAVPTAPPVPTAAIEPPDADEQVQRLLDASITRIDDTHVDVKRAELAKALASYEQALQRGTRAVPAMQNGKPTGIKLYAIRPSSLFARVGLTNGDTLEAITVDGARQVLDATDQLTAAYAKLKTARKVVLLDLVRRGNPLTIAITLK
jgi:type II secretory pathway component PulC